MKKILVFVFGVVLLFCFNGCSFFVLEQGADICKTTQGDDILSFYEKKMGDSGAEFFNGEATCENKVITLNFYYKRAYLDGLEKLKKSKREDILKFGDARIRNVACIEFADIHTKRHSYMKGFMLNGNIDNVRINVKHIDGTVISAFDVNADVCKFR